MQDITIIVDFVVISFQLLCDGLISAYNENRALALNLAVNLI